MSRTTELHIQAAVWTERGEQFAALFMQGEAPDKSTGDQSRADALLQAVRARGLPMTTDPDQVSLQPVKGWGVRLTPSGGITLKWPRLDPLLRDAPVELPDGWLNAARTHGIVLVFVGSGLGLHEHAGDGDAQTPGASCSVSLRTGVSPAQQWRAPTRRRPSRWTAPSADPITPDSTDPPLSDIDGEATNAGGSARSTSTLSVRAARASRG